MSVGFFPSPHPDEILYSIIARYVDVMKKIDDSSAFINLFGYKGMSISFDLPCHLHKFISSLPLGNAYSIESIINENSLFPYYQPFLSNERASIAKEIMCTSTKGGIHLKLGLTSINNSPMKLTYCILCAMEDRRNFGEAYWHRIHQLPGVVVCPIHSIHLETIDLRTLFPHKHKQKILTAESQILNEDIHPIEGDDLIEKRLLSLAKDSIWLLNNGHTLNNAHLMRNAYIDILYNKGYASYNGKLKDADKLVDDFVNYFSKDFLVQFGLFVKSAGHDSWIAQMSSTRNYNRLPIKHILFQEFLGYESEGFFVSLKNGDRLKIRPFGEGPWICRNPACSHYNKKSIYECNYSTRKSCGNDLLVGKFKCECGYTYSCAFDTKKMGNSKKPITINAYGVVWESKLREMFYGDDFYIPDAARKLGVNPSVLRQQLIYIGLLSPKSIDSKQVVFSKLVENGSKYKLLQYERKREQRRKAWLEFLNSHPDYEFKELRREGKNFFEWFMKNDREWFLENRPPKKAIHFIRKIDWETKDSIYSSKISDIGNFIKRLMNPLVRVTITAILRQLRKDGIRFYIRHRQYLPLTFQAIDQVCESVFEFQLRRLQHLVVVYKLRGIIPTRSEFMEKTGLKGFIKSNEKLRIAVENAFHELS